MIPSVAAKMRRNTAFLFTLSLVALAKETIDVKGQTRPIAAEIVEGLMAAEIVEGTIAAEIAEARPIAAEMEARPAAEIAEGPMAAEVVEATAAEIVEGLKEGPAAEVAEEGLEDERQWQRGEERQSLQWEESAEAEEGLEEGQDERQWQKRQSGQRGEESAGEWDDWVQRGELDWLQWGELDWPERQLGPNERQWQRGERQWVQWDDWVQRGELDWLQWAKLDWPERQLGRATNRTAVGGIKLMAGLSSLIIFATIVTILIFLKLGKRKRSGRKDSAFCIKSLCNVSA